MTKYVSHHPTSVKHKYFLSSQLSYLQPRLRGQSVTKDPGSYTDRLSPTASTAPGAWSRRPITARAKVHNAQALSPWAIQVLSAGLRHGGILYFVTKCTIHYSTFTLTRTFHSSGFAYLTTFCQF
jgi:hypothetical protein